MSASVNRILSVFFGPSASEDKRQALQALNARFKKLTGHDLDANNVALVARSTVVKPFVLSLALNGTRTVDLFAQGIEIAMTTREHMPTVTIDFTPAITINVGNPLSLVKLISLWFEAFETSKGHMSTVAAKKGDRLTAHSRVGVEPTPQTLQAQVHCVKIEMGIGSVVVTLDIELSDGFGLALKALTALNSLTSTDKTIVKRVTPGRYEITREITVAGTRSACAAYLSGSIPGRESCVQTMNNMWLILSRSGLDPVILKALGAANLGWRSTNEVELQVRTTAGEVHDVERVRFSPTTEPVTVARTDALVAAAEDGHLDVLSTIEVVGRAWQAHAPRK